MLNFEPTGLALIALRTVLVYLAILVLLRFGGKRELGQMTPFDLVMLLLLANAVQNAMVGPDTSLTGGLIAASAIIGANLLVDRLGLRSAWFRKELLGSPALLVNDGILISESLRREGLSEEEIFQALREHGIGDLTRVKTAVLEIDGTISVIPAEAPSSRTRHRIRGRGRSM
jgi:uncharacterized membrane protein YcaP (DUF421 family)